MMNQVTWQGKLRQLRGEFKREWGKFTHNDRQRIEGEFERIIGQMQQQYGYTSQRAWNELTRYWRSYGKPMSAVTNHSFGGRRQPTTLIQRIGQRVSWLALAFGFIGFLLIIAQWRAPAFRNNGQVAGRTPLKSRQGREKRQEAIRQETVQDAVDEQSWQSFPASDPPASW
jgi:uncharacterized protein YjbJ (UPF0337 family)